MKRMPYKNFNTLIHRLQTKGWYILKPHRRGRRGMSSWQISRRSKGFTCETQADFIRTARYILDGGPKPRKMLP